MIRHVLQNLTRKTRAGRRGSSSIDRAALALNFSYVLHERTDSAAVAAHVGEAVRHAGWLSALPVDSMMAMPLYGLDEIEAMAPQVMLTATVGLPLRLGRLASDLATRPHVVIIDCPAFGGAEVEFFRAQAELTLPDAVVERLVVAAVVLRPGERTLQISSAGSFSWPAERDNALVALETVIRETASQWHAPRALWKQPAELTLPEMLGAATPRLR